MSDVANMPSETAMPVVANEKKWWIVLIIFGLISVLSLAWLVYSLLKVTDYLSDINQLEVSAVNIVKDVNDTTFSRDFEISKNAHTRLSQNVQAYESALANLQSNPLLGNSSTFGAINQAWQAKKPSVDYVIAHQNDINALQDLQKQVKDATMQMQEQYIQVTDQAMAVRMPAATLREIQSQVVLLERISEEITDLTTSTEANAEDFQKYVGEFAKVLASHQQSFGQAAPTLQAIDGVYQQMVAPVVSQLSDLSSPAIQSRQNAQVLSDLATTTQKQLADVNRGIITQKSILIPAIVLFISIFAVILSLLRLLGYRNHLERTTAEKEKLRQRYEMEAQAEQARIESERVRRMETDKERSQMAILRLLDELGDLAEGDGGYWFL